MPDFSTEQLRRNQDVRIHYQPSGAGPFNPTYFLGSDEAQIGFITGGNIQNVGSVEPIWVPSPRRPGTWEWHEELAGGIPKILTKQNCVTTFYELSSRCKDLSDINRGWTGYATIRADGIAGPVDTGARNARTDDNPLTNSLDYTLRDAYVVGQLAFGEEAAFEVVQEVIDGVYYGAGSCGECGIENDGSRLSYYITRANVGSPGAAGQLVYSIDYGLTWRTITITGIGTVNAPVLVDIAGNRLFVAVPGSTSIFYSSINDDTGVPGAWAALTGVGAYNDTWVQGPRNIWFCGANGIIHRTRDIGIAPTLVDNGAGAVALNRIHGSKNTVVAVGANGMVRATNNGGATWSTYPIVVSGATISANLTGVWVWSSKRWYITSIANRLYVTENGGLTWGEVPIPFAGTGAARDVVFTSPEAGYISQDVASTAYLACTIDGGASWANDGSRLLQYPLFERGNRIVTPQSGIADVDSNTVGIAGLRGVGGDGVIMLGVASKL
jgi:photosystem II stability/assembly factor-like uncharacterized protein